MAKEPVQACFYSKVGHQECSGRRGHGGTETRKEAQTPMARHHPMLIRKRVLPESRKHLKHNFKFSALPVFFSFLFFPPFLAPTVPAHRGIVRLGGHGACMALLSRLALIPVSLELSLGSLSSP